RAGYQRHRDPQPVVLQPRLPGDHAKLHEHLHRCVVRQQPGPHRRRGRLRTASVMGAVAVAVCNQSAPKNVLKRLRKRARRRGVTCAASLFADGADIGTANDTGGHSDRITVSEKGSGGIGVLRLRAALVITVALGLWVAPPARANPAVEYLMVPSAAMGRDIPVAFLGAGPHAALLLDAFNAGDTVSNWVTAGNAMNTLSGKGISVVVPA